MEKLKTAIEFIFSSYKRTAAILLIGALALSIPITISLVGQQQDIRQRASGVLHSDYMQATLDNSTGNKDVKVGYTFTQTRSTGGSTPSSGEIVISAGTVEMRELTSFTHNPDVDDVNGDTVYRLEWWTDCNPQYVTDTDYNISPSRNIDELYNFGPQDVHCDNASPPTPTPTTNPPPATSKPNAPTLSLPANNSTPVGTCEGNTVKVSYSWSADSGTTNTLYVDGDNDGNNDPFTDAGVVPISASTPYAQTGLIPGWKYFWGVKSKNAGGETNSLPWNFTTRDDCGGTGGGTAPSQSTGLKVESQTCSADNTTVTATLAWGPVSNADGYNVSKWTGSDWQLLGNVTPGTTTSYKWAGLKPNTGESWGVQAYNDIGKSFAWMGFTTQTCSGGGETGSIATFTATDSCSDNAVKLTWSKYSGTDPVNYLIARLDPGDASYHSVKVVNGSTFSYLDTTVTKGVDYKYRVVALKLDTNTELAWKETPITALQTCGTGGGGTTCIKDGLACSVNADPNNPATKCCSGTCNKLWSTGEGTCASGAGSGSGGSGSKSKSGTVFIDSNDDGIQQAGEPGYKLGATVSMVWLPPTGGADQPRGSAVTDVNGHYKISFNPCIYSRCSYRVTLTVPAGYTVTTGKERSWTLCTGDNCTDAQMDNNLAPISFGLGKPKITGNVYVDTNKNGTKDTGEELCRSNAFLCSFGGFIKDLATGIWYKDTNKNGRYDPSEFPYTGGATVTASETEKTATTDASGNYILDHLPAGNYTIILNVPAGYIATTTNPKSVNLTSSATVNFGIAQGLAPTSTTAPTSPPTTSAPTATSVPTIGLTGNPTITVTPTQTQGGISLSISAIMPGIGSGAGGNTNPARRTREARVIIKNAQNQEVANSSGTLTFDGTKFAGTVNTGQTLSGPHTIKIKLDNTLLKLAPGIQNLSGALSQIPQVTLISGDLNQDNTMDILDYNIFISCFGEKTCDKKNLSDLNDDGKVEEMDLNILLRGFAIRNGD